MTAKESTSISDVLKAHAKKGTIAGSLKDVMKPVKGLPVGNLSIDSITGIGGLPEGRVIEMYGHNSSGKTTTALQTAAALQRKLKPLGERILFIDYEHAIDADYAFALGLDMDDDTVIWSQPESLERGAELTRDLVKTGKIKLMIWDSVAEAQPNAVLEAETGQSQVAIKARVMSQFLQQINTSFHKADCTAIFLNHLQEKFNMQGMKSDTTPGGDALKFYSSMRIKFVQINKQLGKRFNPLTNAMEDFTVSANTKVTVTKNKVSAPNKSCIVRVRYGKGFDNFWSALQVLESYKKITHTGSWYYFDREPGLSHKDIPLRSGRPAFQGEDNLLKYAETNVEWREQVISEALKIVNSADFGMFEPEESDEVDGMGLFTEGL